MCGKHAISDGLVSMKVSRNLLIVRNNRPISLTVEAEVSCPVLCTNEFLRCCYDLGRIDDGGLLEEVSQRRRVHRRSNSA